MGSSGSGAADCTIGPIVWVRRRNGSWWPGKIMEAHELVECNLTSPRTGTPVKLLGREDASVDWYNLEKSKRVKAFRCDEFADCIEKAESAQGMPIKKREKYARREDAILHALELEKELLGNQGKSTLASDLPINSTSGFAKKELDTISDGLENTIGQLGNDKSNHFVKYVDSNIKEDIGGSPIHSSKAKDRSQPLLENDHGEATPRMRGLQDIGLSTAPLKRKLSSSVDSDVSGKSMADDHSQALPSSAPNLDRRNQSNGEEQVGVICQAKRSKCLYMPAKSIDSLDNRGLTPSQGKILTHFEDDGCHPHLGSLDQEFENSSSGFMEDDGSDSSESESDCSESESESETDCSGSESDSSETEPDMDGDIPFFSGAAMPMEVEQDALGRPALGEPGSSSSEDPDDPFLANEAVSKWQLKRKRNIRHLGKKSADSIDGKSFGGHLHGTYQRINRSSFGQRAYGFEDDDFDGKYIGTKMVGLENGGYSYGSRFAYKSPNDTSHNMFDWDDMTWEDQAASRGRWEDRGDRFNPIFIGRQQFGGRPRSMLVDVDLKVQSSYQKERVPIVSLTSKLNGKAIIGHPIQIKVLEDGSSETLIPTNNYYSSELVDHDGNTTLQPAWRTARRTNFRVPRPHLPSVLGGEDSAEDLSYTSQARMPGKKPGMGNFGQKENLNSKSLHHIPRQHPSDRKLQKNQQKKVNLSSNQKTRTLSSIGVQQHFGIKPIPHSNGSQMDGLIKPETSRPTTVACIPVKLVFSRLLEKINRPPSKAVGKMVMPNRDAGRQPS